MRYRLTTLVAAAIVSVCAMVSAAPADADAHGPIVPVALPVGLSPLDLPGQLLCPEAPLNSTDTDIASGETAGAAAMPQPGTTRLGGPPAGLFLMLQGALCIGFFRGRRRLAALLLAALAAGRTGIVSLPRALCGPRHAKAVPCERDAAESCSALAPAADYASLLKRLDDRSGWGVRAANAQMVAAAHSAPQAATVPVAPSHALAAALPLDSSAGLICRFAFGIAPPDRVSLPVLFQSPLFARPPPSVA